MIGDAAEAAATGVSLLAGLGHPGMACSTVARPSRCFAAGKRSRLQQAIAGKKQAGQEVVCLVGRHSIVWLAEKAGLVEAGQVRETRRVRPPPTLPALSVTARERRRWYCTNSIGSIILIV